MNHFRSNKLLFVLVTLLFTAYLAGCSSMPFGKPPGNHLGSCEGRIQLESGRRSNFRIDLYTYDGDGQLFLTIPGMYRYSPIEDYAFSNSHFEIDIASPDRTIEGNIIGDSLKFTGNFEGFSGSISFDMDD